MVGQAHLWIHLAQTADAAASGSAGLIGHMKDWVLSAIDAGGLPVAAIFMALESMIFPLPSELVMPPLGMAVHQGKFAWEAALLAATIGSLVGSLLSYYLGYFGGKPAVVRVGKWFLLNEHHLDLTTRWFARWGGVTVFVCRFVPVVRHFISIPAGIARMNLLKFCVYTVIGAAMWNGFLLWLGWKLESHWETVLKYRRPLDVGMVTVILVTVAAWYWMRLRQKK